jgi:hypothetical protein
LSFVLVIPGASFRLLAKLLLPLAALSILAACGGSGKQTRSTRIVHGPNFSFAAPADWAVRHTSRSAAAAGHGAVVSASVFPLRTPYAPGLFARAARELDRVAAKLAADSKGTMTERTTTTLAGRRGRAYRYTTTRYEARIGFVLAGQREYELFCQGPKGDVDGACALLFSSFTFR